MSNLKPIEEIEHYIKALMQGLNLDLEEKQELEEEWKQHLYDHYASLMKNGSNEEMAVSTVIKQFGDINMLKEEVNKTYPRSIKEHVQKELIISVICIIASLIGPALLIGAHFQIYFIFAPIGALITAYLVHRFVISRLIHPVLSIIGFAAVYAFFITLISKMHGTSLSFELYFSNLFSLEWNRLAGSDGLFQFVTLHMLWYVIVIVQLLSYKNYLPVWERVVNSSFQYWAMLFIAVFFARLQSSAEWGVLFLNVFLIYAFLQQILSIPVIKICYQKLLRFFRSRQSIK